MTTRYSYTDGSGGEFDLVSREALLPPYLASNPYFLEFIDAIDEVFDDVETAVEGLRHIRDPWRFGKGSQRETMLDMSHDGGLSFDSLAQQVNLLGVRFSTPLMLNEESFRVLSKWLGRYWFEKGTESFVNFVSFCLGIELSVDVLWTRDYVTFIKESDLAKLLRPITRPDKVYFSDFDPAVNTEFVAAGGNPDVLASWSLPSTKATSLVHSTVASRAGHTGGTLTVEQTIDNKGDTIVSGTGPYFPTTHVRIRTDLDSFMKYGVVALSKMFYEVDNYNLVIESIEGTLEFEAEPACVYAAMGSSLALEFYSDEVGNPKFDRVFNSTPNNNTAVGYSEWYEFDTGN